MKRLCRRMHRGNKGFTLVELLIVVAIIGVLAAVAVPALVRFIGAGEEEAARVEWETIQTAMSAAMVEHRLASVVPQNVTATTVRDFSVVSIVPSGHAAHPLYLYPGFLRVRHANAIHGDPAATWARYSWCAAGRVRSTAFTWCPTANRYVWVTTP